MIQELNRDIHCLRNGVTQQHAESRAMKRIIFTTAVISSTLFVAGCEPPYPAPQQVQASNPSITYRYRDDQELVQANQNAMTFCSQYRSVPRAANIVDSSDGRKTVVFECVAMAPAPQQAFNPNLSYSYGSDEEFLDASRNAEIYCANSEQRAVPNVSTSPNGTRTVTFHCAPR